MCGIVWYIWPRSAKSVILGGLSRLEYRGYDSAWLALYDHNQLEVYKCKGKVINLTQLLGDLWSDSHLGIGHTRRATHGEPNDVNAHPHTSNDGSIVLVHNGIIENYATIKQQLISKGFVFSSQTDTEVLVNLIQSIRDDGNYDVIDAVRIALTQVEWAYAIVLISQDHPTQMIVAKKWSPLVIGLGDQEVIVASDATPIVEYTQKVIYLNDGEIGILTSWSDYQITTIDNVVQTPYIQQLELNIEQLAKWSYAHFMLKEIYEQQTTIVDCMRGRLKSDWTITLGWIRDYIDKITSARKLTFVACGTSYYSCMVGKYIIEELTRISVDVDHASEYRYRNPIVWEQDIVIAVSQSGETADTLWAITLAKSKGATTLGICNVVGSSIARNTDAGIYTHAWPEIGVASTKAFTAQIVIMILIGLMIGKSKATITDSLYHQLVTELLTISDKVGQVLESDQAIAQVAQQYYQHLHCIFLGRGINYPVAMEWALKLKEISYINAQWYPAAEIKHGPIALIDSQMPIIILNTHSQHYDKVISNTQEVKARKGQIIAIVNPADDVMTWLADHTITVPLVHEILSPLINVIPLQLLAYHSAVLRGNNVDQPRNLAKSVTVE